MKTKILLITTLLFVILLSSGCTSLAQIGPLQSETRSVELDGAEPVKVEINFGAGVLDLSGGSEKLLEADFDYNVAKLKPIMKYSGGTLLVEQPEVNNLLSFTGVADFRNEWGLRLNDQVPMDLKVDIGAGTSSLELTDLALTRLELKIGAGISTIDLRGNWTQDLDVSIDAGATDLLVRLPEDVGTRINVESGPHTVTTTGLTHDGDVYTNAAYGVSPATLNVELKSGIGMINLEVSQPTAQK
jgi:hypothetical protein